MQDRPPLAQFFQQHGHSADSSFEGVLQQLCERSAAAWPDVELSDEDFTRHLASLCPADKDPAAWLATLHAGDLYLACACAKGDPAALAAFERTILSQLHPSVVRVDPVQIDEVRQRLREKLLVSVEGAPPKIARYAGGGALWSWVRVAAVRTALDLHRNLDDQPKAGIDAAALQLGRDPELDYLKTRYRAEFQEALRWAFQQLDFEQRNVLRLQHVLGMTGDRIAAMMQVNRSTVVRWLASARAAMLQETRRRLQEQLRLSPSEFDSLFEFVRSHLDFSMTSLLKETQGRGPT